MQPRKKILSYFLLAIYLLVVAHQSISHDHNSEIDNNSASKHLHGHDSFNDIHHEHHFHVGIFHFLGHLFESINHVSDNGDDHFIVVKNFQAKKITSDKYPIHEYFGVNNLVLIGVYAQSLTDPPYYHIPFLQKLNHFTSLLRAPPSLV